METSVIQFKYYQILTINERINLRSYLTGRNKFSMNLNQFSFNNQGKYEPLHLNLLTLKKRSRFMALILNPIN